MDKKVYGVQFRKRKIQFVFGDKAKLLLIPLSATLLIPIPFLNLVFVGILAGALFVAQGILRIANRRGFYSKDAEYIKITIGSEAFKKKP